MDNEVLDHPKEALNAAIESARLANPVIELGDGRMRAIIPAGYTLQDVTSPERLADHIEQVVTLDDRASLSGYVNRFSDDRSILFADYDAGTIAAHLDWHTNNEKKLQAQHASHIATLKLRNSEEFDRWNEMEGAMHSQEDFALFIEENVSDVADPDHSQLLEICKDLEATRNMKFRSGIRLDNGDRTFTYEDETQVKNDMTVPTEISLSIPLYNGEEPTLIKTKFRFRPSANGLQLGIRWHRVEYQRQATFRQMAFTVAEDTGLPIHFGR